MAGGIVGAVRGLMKTAHEWPEWIYWEQLATQSWGEVAGADQPVFGYLPGIAALVTPFFAVPHPLGAILFATMNAASCVGIVMLLRAEFRSGGKVVQLPLAVMTSYSLYLATQNNQLVAPSMYLTLLAYRLLMRRSWFGSVALGFAVLIKTLPATLFLLFTFLRRFRLAFVGGLILVAASVGLSTMTEGFEVAFDAHAAYPEQIKAQDPNLVLTEGVEPRSFRSNMSLQASIVRLAPWIGETFALILNRTIFWGTLLFVCYLAFVAGKREPIPNAMFALWIAWTTLAAPFGRYYYVALLLPALWLCWPAGLTRDRARWAQVILWLLALTPIATRSGNAVPYVLLTIFTFGWCARRCLRELRGRAEQTGATA